MAGAAAVVAVAAMWLPWFRSGTAGRDSFALFRAAQVLGIEWITPFRVAWFLLPVIPLVAAALWLFDRRSTAVILLIALGSLLAVLGGLSLRSLGPETGSAATAAGGVCTTVFGVASWRRRATGSSSSPA